jgi:hypothetical protein
MPSTQTQTKHMYLHTTLSSPSHRTPHTAHRTLASVCCVRCSLGIGRQRHALLQLQCILACACVCLCVCLCACVCACMCLRAFPDAHTHTRTHAHTHTRALARPRRCSLLDDASTTAAAVAMCSVPPAPTSGYPKPLDQHSCTWRPPPPKWAHSHTNPCTYSPQAYPHIDIHTDTRTDTHTLDRLTKSHRHTY